jgi:hypothetical protein
MAVAGDVIRIVLYFDWGSAISRASAIAEWIVRASPIESPLASMSSIDNLAMSQTFSGSRFRFRGLMSDWIALDGFMIVSCCVGLWEEK